MIGLGAPGSAHAIPWGSLFGWESTCDIDDRDCIRTRYIAEIVSAAGEASSSDYAARDFAQQTDRWTEEELETALDTFTSEGLGEEFFSAYADEIARIEAQNSLDYAGIERAVHDSTWPEALEWQVFIGDAVAQTLMKPDQAAALWQLWQRDQGFFEEHAAAQSIEIMYWGLNHKTNETLAYLASDQGMPEVAMRGVRSFASAAAFQCDEGDRQKAETLIRAYRHYAATQKYEEDPEFLPLGYDAMIALSCAPQAEADAAFDAFVGFVDSKLAEQGRTFGTDWAKRDLENIGIAYALRAHASGDDARALEYLKKAASRDMILGMQLKGDEPVDVSVWDVLVGAEWPEYVELANQRLSEELAGIENHSEAKAYDPDLNLRFAYFADEYDPSFEICCTGPDMLERMMDTIEDASASRNVDAIARKLIALIERLEAIPERSFSSALSLRLRLAKLDREKGCTHSAALQAAWLSEVSQEEFDGVRAEALANFLDYMAVEPKPAPADGCYFSD